LLAAPLENWHWLNPRPQGNSLNGVAFVGGKFVAVGVNGTILQSTSGVAWTAANPVVPNALMAVGGAAGTIVAVGSGGIILTSPDGNTWTTQPSPTSATLTGVAAGSGRFVAVGSVVLSSSDAMNWNIILTNQSLSAVSYANGKFAAVGSTRLVSDDGLIWLPSNLSDIPYPNYPNYKSVAYGFGHFVAMSDTTHYGGIRYTQASQSTNGVNWSSQDILAAIASGVLAYGNGVFVAVNGGTQTSMTSPDGVTWSAHSIAFPEILNGIAFGNGIFVAVGNSGEITTSPDGVSWTEQRSVFSDTSGTTSGLATAGNRTVAVSAMDLLYGTALLSTNGIDFSPATVATGSGDMRSVTTDGIKRFVAVGYGGAIHTSDDRITWSNRNSPSSTTLNDVAFANGRYLAVGEGAVATSPNGDSWVLRPQFTTADLLGVTFGNSLWVAVGVGGTIFTSPDTLFWDPQNATNQSVLNKIQFGNGLFVAVGQSGTILTSTQGTFWTTQASGTTNHLKAVVYGHGVWLAVGENGTVLSSYDGKTWTKHSAGTFNNFAAVGYRDSTFTIAGQANLMLHSDSLDTPLLVEPRRLVDGRFHSYFVGPIGISAKLQSADSPIASSWTPVMQFTNNSGVTLLEDPAAGANSTRFYRVTP